MPRVPRLKAIEFIAKIIYATSSEDNNGIPRVIQLRAKGDVRRTAGCCVLVMQSALLVCSRVACDGVRMAVRRLGEGIQW